MTRRRARALAAVALAGLAVSAASCGDDDDSNGSKGADAFSQVERKSRQAPDPNRAAPRWEPLAMVRGSGRQERPIEVESGAINWQARWHCTQGSLVLSVNPPPEDGNPLRRARCPSSGKVESLQTGRLTLGVDGSAPWRVSVWQQVTTPLDEAPLPAMTVTGATRLASGRFYAIERRGEGTATLFKLPGGRLALRLQGFRTSANAELFVWLSEAAKPRTTRQALRAPHRQFAALKSTLGNQNYLLPRDVQERSIRSVVIWCDPIRIAYTAATLAP